MLKIRRPLGRLIFNMGIAIPGKTVFLIETAPWSEKWIIVHHCWGAGRETMEFAVYFIILWWGIVINFRHCSISIFICRSDGQELNQLPNWSRLDFNPLSLFYLLHNNWPIAELSFISGVTSFVVKKEYDDVPFTMTQYQGVSSIMMLDLALYPCVIWEQFWPKNQAKCDFYSIPHRYLNFVH